MNIVFWVLLIANVLLSFAFPMVVIPWISKGANVSEIDAFLCSMLSAIILFIIEIFAYTNILYQQKKHQDNEWLINSETDKKLFNIKQKMEKINQEYYPANDLFKFYLNKKLDDLSRLTEDADVKKEIRINENMIELTKEMYYSAFTGDANSVFRPMYLCNDNEFFFEGFGKNYFELALTLVNKGKLKEVRRLFVYYNEAELNDMRIKKLIYFHNKTPHFDCKVMHIERYRHIMDDYGLRDYSGSFAVYGTRYVYTERTAPTLEKVEGYYSKKPSTIITYTNFFEECWRQASVHCIDSSKDITFENVFDKGWSLG